MHRKTKEAGLGFHLATKANVFEDRLSRAAWTCLMRGSIGLVAGWIEWIRTRCSTSVQRKVELGLACKRIASVLASGRVFAHSMMVNRRVTVSDRDSLILLARRRDAGCTMHKKFFRLKIY